jgi:glycosyltransferase involved in cell wall biosynthesis
VNPETVPERERALPLVTIAIPTYNRADGYLAQTLRSVGAQTYPNLDFIVADNASTDGTADLISRWSDPRTRYFRHSRNIGATNNFNFCLEHARGDYFLLLQDDDLIDADFVAACVNATESDTRVGIIRTGVRLIDFSGEVVRKLPNRADGLPTDLFFLQWFSGGTSIYLCNTLFRTDALRQVGGFRSKHNCYDDTMAIMQLAAKYGRVDVQAVKASARIHERELGFQSPIDDWCEDSLELLDLMCQLAPANQGRIRQAGLSFFSRANFSRASAKRSRFERLAAYATVVRHFKYRRWPSLALLLRILDGTSLHAGLRLLKRGCKLAWSRT